MRSPTPPALNLTIATGFLLAANLAVHLVRLVLPPELDQTVLFHTGFIPSFFLVPGQGPVLPEVPTAWLTPFSYTFLHGDFLHLLVNMGFLLAFGTALERRLGAASFLAFYFFSGILAVAGTVALFWISQAPVLVIGASGAVAGLFGGAARFIFDGAIADAHLPIRRRRGLMLAVVFIGMNLVFGVIGFADFGGIRAIAWEAHITGFAVGYFCFPFFDRRS